METSPDTKPGEEWAPVPGYEDSYLVSTHGRVWSIKRTRSDRAFEVGGRYLKIDVNGAVELHKDAAVQKVQLARLVLLAHAPPPASPARVATRIDKTKGYSLDNLKWSRPITQAKLSKSEVIAIYREAKREALTQKAIAERYGTTRPTVSAIKNGRVWKHITEKITPPASESAKSPFS